MKSIKEKSEKNIIYKTNFFKTVLEDKLAMQEYIKKNGSLIGFKSDHFEFAKPL